MSLTARMRNRSLMIISLLIPPAMALIMPGQTHTLFGRVLLLSNAEPL